MAGRPILCLALAAVLALPTAAAQSPAAPPRREPSPGGLDLRIGLAGTGEIWQDPFITRAYRSSRFAGTGFASLGLWRFVGLDAELGYMRMAARTDTGEFAPGALELVPIAINACARATLDGGTQAFAGAGPAFTVFNERADVEDDEWKAVSGMKVGVDARVGVRIPTSLVEPSSRPGSRGVQGVEVQVLAGRRFHGGQGEDDGFDLSAWRVGLGFAARL